MPTIYDAVGEFQERLLRNERRADYLEIAEKRIAHWALQPTLQE